MGEIRFEQAPKRSWSRWAIPLALIALVALAAVYEFLRPNGGEAPRATDARPARVQPQAPSDSGAAPPPSSTRDAPVSGPAGTPLPNPLASTEAPAPAADTAAAPAATPSPTTGGIVSTVIPPAAPGEPVLVIVYGGKSWTEVRDASGKVLLSLTGSPGMTQSVTGTPPLDVVIGSVADVSMRFRGAPVNLDPYRRANVARLRLE
jgi:cytoskeleton protein RodZ